jgi:predicted nucleic acid-binding protein
MHIYLDTCVLIYLIEKHEPYVQPLRQRLNAAVEAGMQFATSELVRMECLVKPVRDLNFALSVQFDEFFQSTEHWLTIARPEYELATTLRARHRLKALDALHLAAAMTHQCEEFWTNDTRLSAAAADRIRIVTPHLHPTTP